MFANEDKARAKVIRAIVWNWNIDAFKNYSVPEKYKNESAVVLAHHHQIEVSSKNKFKFYATTLRYSEAMYCTYIKRTMIKLNDKKALDDHSELSFKEKVVGLGYSPLNKLETIAGARVIKPDGTIHEIDIDADAVTITEGKDNKEAHKKVAIKGLETGDIIDYFFVDIIELETINLSPQTFLFAPYYPTLSYSVECVLEKGLTTEYRPINGAPDFERSYNADGNLVLKVEQKDLEGIGNLEDIRWLSAYRDLPVIRLTILNNESQSIYKSLYARKSGVYKNVPYSEILKDKKDSFDEWSDATQYKYIMGDINTKANSAIANFKKKNPTDRKSTRLNSSH